MEEINIFLKTTTQSNESVAQPVAQKSAVKPEKSL